MNSVFAPEFDRLPLIFDLCIVLHILSRERQLKYSRLLFLKQVYDTAKFLVLILVDHYISSHNTMHVTLFLPLLLAATIQVEFIPFIFASSI